MNPFSTTTVDVLVFSWMRSATKLPDVPTEKQSLTSKDDDSRCSDIFEMFVYRIVNVWIKCLLFLSLSGSRRTSTSRQRCIIWWVPRLLSSTHYFCFTLIKLVWYCVHVLDYWRKPIDVMSCSICFLWFISAFMDVYSGWTSDIIIMSGNVQTKVKWRWREEKRDQTASRTQSWIIIRLIIIKP